MRRLQLSPLSHFYQQQQQQQKNQRQQVALAVEEEEEERYRRTLSFLEVVAAAVRRSLVVCGGMSNDGGERGGRGGHTTALSSADIGWPTDVQHVAHVTFDPFDGFLGLPADFLPHVPSSAPSASTSVFGVSATSMQCSYDSRGNSVPTIMLLMQQHLYSQGGLEVEGIFRINAVDGQEVYVREQLSKGVVPEDIDLHCLAGLIKAWFRELPTGILDSITPDEMMHCNSEEECLALVRRLPPIEAALLDWAVNLMADVAEHELQNKMNARNIAMVFAPNMTQMADPLTALIHAVQVMNFLKTLIMKMLREREEAAEVGSFQSCSETSDKDETQTSDTSAGAYDEKLNRFHYFDRAAFGKFLFNNGHCLEGDYKVDSFGVRRMAGEKQDEVHGQKTPSDSAVEVLSGCLSDESGSNRNSEGIIDKLNLRKGVRKLCAHSVFQLSKS